MTAYSEVAVEDDEDDRVKLGGFNRSRFGNFIPAGSDFKNLPEPEAYLIRRYSNAHLRALANYVFSQEVPANPHEFDALAQRGQ